MFVKIASRVRGLFTENYAEAREDVQVVTNNRGDLVVVQSMPELAELVRLGNSWQINATTGQAALTALPTTTAGLTLTNNEAATGKCYVIDSFGSAEEVIDATQTDVTALFAMINKRTSTAPSSGTAETTFISLSARANYGGTGTVKRGATVANDGWTPHSTVGAQMAAAVAGANWKINEALVRGLYVVPPGASFSVQTVKAAAAAAAQQFFFVRWHEVQLIWLP
jgi:hypothetical protein